MSQYDEAMPSNPPTPSPLAPDEVARGDYWSILQREGHYLLEYISGELAGRLKQIPITLQEGDQIMRGEVTAEQVIIAHGAY